MSNFFVLINGEIQRMKKYNILTASIFVSLIWIGILHFINVEDVTNIIPLLIFMDATSMAMLLVGVTFIYEKQEGTIRTLLVSPISKAEYILAKNFSNIIFNIFSLVIMYGYSKLFKEVNLNFFAILGSVILVSFFHSMVGFLLTYFSKDFTDLLMGMMKYVFIFMTPVLLEEFNIITNNIFKKALYIIPTKASLTLLKGATGSYEPWKIRMSILYIMLGIIILFYIVWKKFDEYAMKEGGE